MHQTKQNIKPKRNKPIIGIVGDAKTLGVNRNTLYKMLHNYPAFGNLKTLRKRYEALQEEKKRNAANASK